MKNPEPVLIPLLNTNEPEALLAALHVTEGQLVSVGDLLCTLETTKSTADVSAEASGYVAGLQWASGQIVRAGDVLCYLAEDPAWRPVTSPPESSTSTSDDALIEPDLPVGLRITRPALALARSAGLELARLPLNRLVTESMVRQMVEKPPQTSLVSPDSAFDPTAILVYGGGGHGKSLIDLIRVLGVYHIIGVIDDGIPAGQTILGVPVLGGAESLKEVFQRGVRLAVNAVGGIGNLDIRVKVFQQLAQAGFTCPALVHPTAFVEASARLAPGVQVFPQAYIGSDVQVGFGSIVNTGAIVSHDCILGDYANLSPGALLAGEVHIGAGTLVGMGATINLRVKVGQRARIGNGATVKQDVPDHGIVRAGAVFPG